MNKELSTVMKGWAILFMLFHHLFDLPNNMEIVSPWLYVGNEPLVYLLSRATNPVAMYLILGGYGLYKVYQKGDTHRWSRIFKLYFHYWIILLIAILIGHYIYPHRYPGQVLQIIKNFTGYHTTYNAEMWFLLPYVILALLSPFYFKVIDKVKPIWVIAGTLFLYLVDCFIISQMAGKGLGGLMWFNNPMLSLQMLFNFSLGALAAKYNYFGRFRSWFGVPSFLKYLGLVVALICLVSLQCVFRWNLFYAFLIMSVLSIFPYRGLFKKLMSSLGRQSMNMWMIHSWLCYYLFKDFFYSFQYPIVILIILTAFSYYAGVVIDKISKPVEEMILTKKEMAQKPEI